MIPLALPRPVLVTLRAAARDRQRRYAARAARGFVPAPGRTNSDALAAAQLAEAVAAIDAALAETSVDRLSARLVAGRVQYGEIRGPALDALVADCRVVWYYTRAALPPPNLTWPPPSDGCWVAFHTPRITSCP